jgi:hypothetical protein
MYNLFLDDDRFPFNGGTDVPVDFELDSAYDLTRDKRYKDLDWVIVRSFPQFVEMIEKRGLPEMISFDHDLKDEHYYHYRTFTIFTGWIDYTVVEGTGHECAKWLINYLLNNDLDCPTILIHTQNTTGAKNIWKLFENFNENRK